MDDLSIFAILLEGNHHVLSFIVRRDMVARVEGRRRKAYLGKRALVDTNHPMIAYVSKISFGNFLA